MADNKFKPSSFEHITRLVVPDYGKQAILDWIAENHIESTTPDAPIEYQSIQAYSEHRPFLAVFTGKFNYDYREQVFLLYGWYEEKEWKIARINEMFVSALAGEVNQVVKRWKQEQATTREE